MPTAPHRVRPIRRAGKRGTVRVPMVAVLIVLAEPECAPQGRVPLIAIVILLILM